VTCARSRFDSSRAAQERLGGGQQHRNNGIQMAEARVAKGRVMVFGNELLFRTQPHGNFKFFFNSLYLSVAPDMK
jgi:hypothetical protein